MNQMELANNLYIAKLGNLITERNVYKVISEIETKYNRRYDTLDNLVSSLTLNLQAHKDEYRDYKTEILRCLTNYTHKKFKTKPTTTDLEKLYDVTHVTQNELDIIYDSPTYGLYDPIVMLNDIPKSLNYVPDSGILSSSIHRGQMKLLMAEVQFFIHYYTKYDKDVILVYAGSAPGHKTIYLWYLVNKMSNNKLKFICVDPSNHVMRIDKTDGTQMRDIEDDPIVGKLDNYKSDSKPIYHNEQFISRVESVIYRDNMTHEKKGSIISRIKNSNSVIFIFQCLATPELFKYFSTLKNDNNDILFMSDIRSKDDEKSHPTELDILKNNALQILLIEALKPTLSSLKFRTPFCDDQNIQTFKESYKSLNIIPDELEKVKSIQVEIDGKLESLDLVSLYLRKKFAYYDGDIYIQTWAGKTSTETRLITTGKKFKSYDVSNHENLLRWYNIIARSFIPFKNPILDNLEFNRKMTDLGIDYCADCALDTYIWTQYYEIAKPRFKHSLYTLIKFISWLVYTRYRRGCSHGCMPKMIDVDYIRFVLMTTTYE